MRTQRGVCVWEGGEVWGARLRGVARCGMHIHMAQYSTTVLYHSTRQKKTSMWCMVRTCRCTPQHGLDAVGSDDANIGVNVQHRLVHCHVEDVQLQHL